MSSELVLMVAVSPMLISWWLCGKFRQPTSRFYLADTPNARSMHQTPVGRSGGLAMVAALLFVWATLLRDLDLPVLTLILAVGALAALGWLDDRGHVPALWRLLAQLGIVTLALAWGFGLDSVVLSWSLVIDVMPLVLTFAALASAWMINLTNFSDGVDGYVAGVAVIGFAAYALLGWLAGDMDFVLLNVSIVSAVLGFWWWNRPPAHLFMGDTGSSVLGLLAALIAWLAQIRGIAPAWLIVPIFSVLIIDTGVTLLRRLMRGERVWQAHRQHYYQRARRGGVGPVMLLAWAYGLSLLGVVLALIGAVFMAGYFLIATVIIALIFVGIMVLIDRRWPV